MELSPSCRSEQKSQTASALTTGQRGSESASPEPPAGFSSLARDERNGREREQLQMNGGGSAHARTGSIHSGGVGL